MQSEKQNRVDAILEDGKSHGKRRLPGIAGRDETLERLEKGNQLIDKLTDTTADERKSAQKAKKELAHRMRPSRLYMFERFFSGMNNVVGKFFHAMFKTMRERRERHQRLPSTPPAAENRRKAPVKANPPAKKGMIDKKEPAFKKATQAELLRHLQRTVLRLGYGKALPPEAQIALLGNDASFQLSRSTSLGADQVRRTTVFEKGAYSGLYHPAEVQATLKKYVHLDTAGIKDVNAGELDKKMRRVNWKHDFTQPGITVSNDPAENRQMLALVNSIFRDLFRLKTSADPKANVLHDQLAYKYFADTPSAGLIHNMADLKRQNETTAVVNLRSPHAANFTDEQLFNLLNGQAVKPAGSGEWFQLKASGGERDGISYLEPAALGTGFHLEASLYQAGAGALVNSPQFGELKKSLENGNAIRTTVVQNGVSAERMIRANPGGGNVSIDWQESSKNKLYQPSTRQIAEFHKYNALHAGLKGNGENMTGKVVSMVPDTAQGQGDSMKPRR